MVWVVVGTGRAGWFCEGEERDDDRGHVGGCKEKGAGEQRIRGLEIKGRTTEDRWQKTEGVIRSMAAVRHPCLWHGL